MNISISISELKSIIESQWHNGMLPHIRYVEGNVGYSPDADEWGVENMTLNNTYQTSGITQPPVMGLALEKIIHHHNFNFNHINDIIYITNGLEKFHTFLLNARDPYQEHLVTLIHPWESGLDNSPCFDTPNKNAKLKLNKLNIQQQIKKRKDLKKVIKAFRPGNKDYEVYGKLMGFYKLYNYNQLLLATKSPFRVQDLMYNILLLQSIKSMISIYSFLFNYNKNPKYHDLKIHNIKVFSNIEQAIKNKLFNKQRNEFYSYNMSTNKPIYCNSIQSLFASISLEKNEKRIERLIQEYQGTPSIPFLSTSNKSSHFNAIKYWRGPIWPIMNWLIIEQLKTKHPNLAKKYSKITLHLIAENYNLETTNKNAMKLMYFNLVNNTFTTPSKNQYQHAWLWDSAFASIGWLHVNHKFESNIYDKIYKRKDYLMQQGINLYQIRKALKKNFKVALFDEYYVGIQTNKYASGEPIGSEMMTWTASVYLDLYNFLYFNKLNILK